MQELELDHHMETSALTGHNIQALFETLTKHLYLENNSKLGEFREDGASNTDNNRSSSISFKRNNVDLYQPKSNAKKKKKCACWLYLYFQLYVLSYMKLRDN